jgi:predicted O-methyltransferase YrrM
VKDSVLNILNSGKVKMSVKKALTLWGLTLREELEFLENLATIAPEGWVVELGTFNGRSTAALCGAVGDHRVITIDDWTLQRYGPNSETMAREGLGKLGFTPRFVTSKSWEVPSGIEKVAMIFIDTTHEGPVLEKELAAWLPLLVPQGIVAMHDYSVQGWPTLFPVIDRVFVGPVWASLGMVNTLVAFRWVEGEIEMRKEKARPFLSIITRCYKRPKLLEINVKSVDAQSDQDIEHLLIQDNRGVGIGGANQSFFRLRDLVEGQWVYILDDDDRLVYPDFVKELKKIVRQHDPQVVMVKVEVERPGYILPDTWENRPILNRIRSLNYIVKSALWKRYISHFAKPAAGDFAFIDEIWKSEPRIFWWNGIVAKVPCAGGGRSESDIFDKEGEERFR